MARISVRIAPRNYRYKRSRSNPVNLIPLKTSKQNFDLNAPSQKRFKRVLPNILYLNARSLFNKIDELSVIINQQNADVIMVTETWLTDAIPDAALHISGFTIVRRDRSSRRGGGVAIYIRESLPFKIRPDCNNPDYECLWITLRPKWLPRKISKLALACVYLPPSMNTETIERFYEYVCQCYDSLISESPDTAITVTGDFNPESNGFQERVSSKTIVS